MVRHDKKCSMVLLMYDKKCGIIWYDGIPWYATLDDQICCVVWYSTSFDKSGIV